MRKPQDNIHIPLLIKPCRPDKFPAIHLYFYTGMKTICIIGGGFSGSATAMRLLEKDPEARIVLVNGGQPLIRGIAYSTTGEEHLLNVPAGRMGILASAPAHFTDWLRSKPEYSHLIADNLAQSFLPRMVYGVYLQEQLNQYSGHKNLEIIASKAISVSVHTGRYVVRLENTQAVTADHLVLALGNFLPATPKIANSAVFDNTHYFRNPWNNDYLKDIRNNETVLLIGTGLTMVDCVLSLKKINFKGKIIAVSPRGYIPASHTNAAPYPDFSEELKDKSLREIFKIVRQHLEVAYENDLAWQAVIDSIRPYAQQIWLSLDKKGKQQFTSHLRHIWGVARHRLPEAIFAQIMDAVNSGQLEIIGGRVQNIEEEHTGFRVSIRPRKSHEQQTLQVTRIVNCTGPQINYAEIGDPFVKSLIENNIIRPDGLKMGIAATPAGQVLGADEKPVKNVYAIGSLLRGVLWETTAVPEIRVQAENVARQICESIN